MSANARTAQGSHVATADAPVRVRESSNRFVRLSQLHKLSKCEQVAAVCYRLRGADIEFLLVQTRGSRRWTFPKGSAERGLTHAQAAALEAFEEAGVHGRIEEASFAHYLCRKRGAAPKSSSRSGGKGFSVNAYLCQVMRLSKPKEADRNRTWFSAQDASRRLRDGRENDGAQLAHVVDKAVVRIQRLQGKTGIVAEWLQQNRQEDALQKVQFEAVDESRGGMASVSLIPYIRRQLGDMRRSFDPSLHREPSNLLPGAVLQFCPTQESTGKADGLPGKKRPKALGNGTKSD